MGLFFSDDTEDDEDENYESDSGISEEEILIIDESREVIQNQIEVLKHQREIASSVLRLSITLLILLIGSLLSLSIFRRDSVVNIISNMVESTNDPVVEQFIFVGISFTALFIFALFLFLVFFLRGSLRILREREDWGINTVPNSASDKKMEILKRRQEKLIDKNEASIDKNEPRLTEIAESSIRFLTSFSVSGVSITIFAHG